MFFKFVLRWHSEDPTILSVEFNLSLDKQNELIEEKEMLIIKRDATQNTYHGQGQTVWRASDTMPIASTTHSIMIFEKCIQWKRLSISFMFNHILHAHSKHEN